MKYARTDLNLPLISTMSNVAPDYMGLNGQMEGLVYLREPNVFAMGLHHANVASSVAQ